VIRPALEADRVVLCDRYADSTLAYQGAGRGLDRELLTILNRAATSGLRPHLTLLYDIDPAVGLGRRNAGGSTNRLDREPAEFYARVRTCYLELAAAEPRRFVVLDGAMAASELERVGWSAIEERLQPQP
jgi:dTMP kinase